MADNTSLMEKMMSAYSRVLDTYFEYPENKYRFDIESIELYARYIIDCINGHGSLKKLLSFDLEKEVNEFIKMCDTYCKLEPLVESEAT